MELSEGTWPKIKIYGPPGGRPNTVWLLKWSCRVAEYCFVFQTLLLGSWVQLTSQPKPINPATGQGRCRQPSPVAGSIGRGRLVNWTRSPNRRVWKTKLYSATRHNHFKSQNVQGHPAGGPYILIFGQVPLPQFHMDCRHRWAINGLFRTNCESRLFLWDQSRKEHSTKTWRPTYSLGFK